MTSAFTCPKRMTYGPCGGVGADGSCEVAAEPCVFPAVVAWRGPTSSTAAGSAFLDLLGGRPIVLAAFPDAPLDARSIADCADVLRGTVDAVLLGDSGAARVQFPPAYRAMLVRQHGLAVWAGLNCRDRNRVALEGELAALAHAGVAGVHCVTGDHPALGYRPDATAVFDLEGHDLVPLARAAGLLVSVAESPSAPPVGQRAARLAQKVRAGAQLGLLQYLGEAADVARFVADCWAAGADVPLLPGVPVVIDREGAELLASFPAAVLPAGYVEAVLAAPDPFAAGVDVAVAYGRDLLGVDGVGGVVLAGGSAPGQERPLASALARIGRALGSSG